MMERRTWLRAGGGLLLAQALAAPPGQAQSPPAGPPPLPYRAHRVVTPDGVSVQAYEYGNPRGPAIFFIHGYMQAGLSWERQVTDPAMLRDFHMVTYDMRGHGMSDKPVGDQYYKTGKAWADEVAAVIRATNLVRPVLVGWSYGGRLLGDYLTHHGHGGIAGLNHVAALSSTADPSRFGPGGRFSGPAGSGHEDPATAIRNTIAFLRACFEVQPAQADFETILAFNMLVPRHVRLSLLGRQGVYDEQLRALNIPVLVTQGAKDQLVMLSMARHTAAMAPGARLSIYGDIGHSPFFEDAPRYNRELSDFVRAAQR